MFTDDQMMFHQYSSRPLPMERKWKSHVELAPNCPRCASTNTKFCYYNNYSLSQPRYFCKACRRYWTKGGSLRNVPVGGGCRKTRRAKAVRASQTDRVVSLNNYSRDLTSSSVDSFTQENQTSNGSDIDLAVVFAKFLNQDSSVNPNEFSNSLTVEKEKVSDLIQESDDFLEGLPPVLLVEDGQQENQDSIQEFIESPEMDAFGLQTFLGDQEMVHEALWSDQEAATLSNVLTWESTLLQQQQQQERTQEFDSFTVEDQLKASAANLMSDINSWYSFDPSGFEIFSRP
ncbi:hypothetical protein JCGZ_25217 [Jatropha curcas]|uniref:Dof zinc finger protein n=1 Tax=Jatropha curcas TaxID=180498 RepID=A0A067L3I5_JATCU|nr:dof zinc finger protein DOF1.2 [Jatropha curcas]KDP43031.1 hypothetical protein JCGZ_25217 [Jatropha curcas]